jgi:hypothetical protein
MTCLATLGGAMRAAKQTSLCVAMPWLLAILTHVLMAWFSSEITPESNAITGLVITETRKLAVQMKVCARTLLYVPLTCTSGMTRMVSSAMM